MDKKMLQGIESGVRPVVKDLNENGQETLMSCHGHREFAKWYKPKPRWLETPGWISFKLVKGFNKETARRIMKEHGLKKIRFATQVDKPGVVFAYFERIS
jgi:hypothetical protein